MKMKPTSIMMEIAFIKPTTTNEEAPVILSPSPLSANVQLVEDVKAGSLGKKQEYVIVVEPNGDHIQHATNIDHHLKLKS